MLNPSKIRRNRYQALNYRRCSEKTKAKSEEYRVKLGRLRCGIRGRLYFIVTLTHRESLNWTALWLRLHTRE